MLAYLLLLSILINFLKFRSLNYILLKLDLIILLIYGYSSFKHRIFSQFIFSCFLHSLVEFLLLKLLSIFLIDRLRNRNILLRLNSFWWISRILIFLLLFLFSKVFRIFRQHFRCKSAFFSHPFKFIIFFSLIIFIQLSLSLLIKLNKASVLFRLLHLIAYRALIFAL